MKQIRYAVVGAWGHLAIPLDEISRLPEAIAVGLCPGVSEDDMAGLKASRPALASAVIYPNIDTLITKAKPQLIILSTHLYRITPLAIAVAQAGCHLICEKPLAIDSSSLALLEESVKKARIQCVPMLHNRQHPLMAAAMSATSAGILGEIALVNARKSYRWGTRPVWFGQRKLYGGTIPWIGIHALDFIHAFNPDWTSVFATHANIDHHERRESEDACSLLVRFANGGSATASIDFLRPTAAPSHGDDFVRVVGSKGVLEINLERGESSLILSDKVSSLAPLPNAPRTYSNLFNALLGREPHDFTATQRGFLLTRAALIARESADIGKPLEL